MTPYGGTGLAFDTMETANPGEMLIGDVRDAARDKIADVESRMRELGRIRDALQSLVDACEANQETCECPILDALDEPETEKGVEP